MSYQAEGCPQLHKNRANNWSLLSDDQSIVPFRSSPEGVRHHLHSSSVFLELDNFVSYWIQFSAGLCMPASQAINFRLALSKQMSVHFQFLLCCDRQELFVASRKPAKDFASLTATQCFLFLVNRSQERDCLRKSSSVRANQRKTQDQLEA